jgi:hypothetical protein
MRLAQINLYLLLTTDISFFWLYRFIVLSSIFSKIESPIETPPLEEDYLYELS